MNFKHTNVIHYNPIHAIHSFNRWAIDEILVINVSRSQESKKCFSDVIHAISSECFVPLSAGGWVQNVADAKDLFLNGADKIIVNTTAFERPEFITELARKYGSQAVVVSIDAKKDEQGIERVVLNRGSQMTNSPVVEWAKKAERFGAGELFINSIPHDGARKGYNLELMRQVKEAMEIPVIAMGGVLTWEHLTQGADFMDAIAAANIFHYTEHSTKKAKQFLLDRGFNFRKV